VKEKSESTIARALAPYELGKKLRQLRLRKKIALVDLGKHTGLSPSMLSQLENGKMIPTLPTLARIAMVFDVGMEHFFGEKRQHRLFAIVRAAERMRFPERADAPTPSYFFESLTFSSQGKGMQAYLVEFPPRNASEVSKHFTPATVCRWIPVNLTVIAGRATLRRARLWSRSLRGFEIT